MPVWESIGLQPTQSSEVKMSRIGDCPWLAFIQQFGSKNPTMTIDHQMTIQIISMAFKTNYPTLTLRLGLPILMTKHRRPQNDQLREEKSCQVLTTRKLPYNPFYPTMPYSNNIPEVREPQWLSISTNGAKQPTWELFQTPTTGDHRWLLLCFSLYHTFTPLLLYPFYHYLITLLQGHMTIHAVTL